MTFSSAFFKKPYNNIVRVSFALAASCGLAGCYAPPGQTVRQHNLLLQADRMLHDGNMGGALVQFANAYTENPSVESYMFLHSYLSVYADGSSMHRIWCNADKWVQSEDLFQKLSANPALQKLPPDMDGKYDTPARLAEIAQYTIAENRRLAFADPAQQQKAILVYIRQIQNGQPSVNAAELNETLADQAAKNPRIMDLLRTESPRAPELLPVMDRAKRIQASGTGSVLTGMAARRELLPAGRIR